MILTLFVIGIGLVISSIVLLITNNYKESKRKVIEDEKKITNKIRADLLVHNSNFETINNKLVEIKEKLETFTSTYEEMFNLQKDFFGNIEEVENLLNDSYEQSKYISEKCKTRYSSEEVNGLCTNFYFTLEELTNNYVYLNKFISKKVEEYNIWFADYKGDAKLEKINLYETKHIEYVDLNDDKTFLGMFEE